ncbi:hypothetical protein PILCRDRAFT_15438 [Piloderma croceum F 1598]|uniref:DUF6532 domain-containing protein n=1 Tax=Piloderma croceum (strain F 1598) TaxID=765440 RepID=A0A0C3EZQ6_PILCF|nr:hypothetical protein PILCRDRAFT_15438 [Piloderma croceum F 1598]
MSSGRKGIKRLADTNTLTTQPSKKSRKEPIPKGNRTKESEKKSAFKVRSSTVKACASQTNNENKSVAPSRIGTCRSQRPNIGEGGALLQLTNMSDAIERQPAPPKNRVANIPSAQLNNPMAPANTKPKRGRPPKVTAPTTHAQSAAPLPTHLVPVGTEPMIPVPQLGALGHQYGFSAGTSTKPIGAAPGPSGDQVFTSATAQAGSSNSNSGVNPQFRASSNNLNIDPTLMNEAPVNTILHPTAATTANDRDENDEDENSSGSSAGDMDIMSESEDDGRSTEDEIMSLVQRFGQDGTCYEDSRVVDILHDSHVDQDRLLKLLHRIEQDWIKDQAREPREQSFEVVPSRPHNYDMVKDGDNNGVSYDVLQVHHDRNKPHKAPLFAPMESDNDAATELENTESDINSVASDEESEDELGGSTRAKRHSQTPRGSANNPTQLQFYPLQWTEVLELAKTKWRLSLLIKWAFPKQSKFDTTNVLKECLTTAIADHGAEGGLVEKGKDAMLLQSHDSQYRMAGYYPKYMKEMITLIWEDSSSFRGELKKCAREVVRLLYDLFPDAGKGKFTQKRYANHIKQAVEDLLQDGAFMHDGTDDEGHTNNLTHPAVGELRRLFLYAANNRLGHLFPDVFGSEIPSMTVALVITAIKCALDEWKDGVRTTIPFSAQEYRAVYQQILRLIAKVEANEFHAAKFLRSRRDWAAAGNCEVDTGETETTFGL